MVHVFMINRVIILFYLGRRLMVKNIKVLFLIKVKNMSRTFQGLFFKILRIPQGLAPSECSYKKEKGVDFIGLCFKCLLNQAK